MSVSEHANYLLNEYGRLQFDYAAYCKPDGEPLRNEARNNLETYIAELEEQVWNLNLENERLEEAYWIDETISPDGALKPSVRKLLERLEKAETDLRLSDDLVKALDNRIAELEAAQARWIPVSERLPKESGWYRVGAIDVFDEGYTDEAYFDANKTELGWHTCSSNVIYCWLDGVPELPKPPEVQQ